MITTFYPILISKPPVSSGVFVVADQTLRDGGPAIEISGTTYPLRSSDNAVVIDGNPTSIPGLQTPALQASLVVIGHVTATPVSYGVYVAAAQTLGPGGSAVEITGTTYSLPTSGNNVVINDVTSSVAHAGTPEVSHVLFGSATALPLSSGAYVIASQTLRPGGSAIQVSGAIYSLPASGNTVFIDEKPTALDTVAPDAILTIGSQTYTAVTASVQPLVIASQTLIPNGSAIILGGTVYSLPATGTSVIVINGQTTSFATAASSIPYLSAGSQELSFTPLRPGIIVASQTLYPGGSAITVDGQILSLPSTGSAVVIKSGTSMATKVLDSLSASDAASSAVTALTSPYSTPTAGLGSTGTENAGASATSSSTADAGRLNAVLAHQLAASDSLDISNNHVSMIQILIHVYKIVRFT